MSGKKRKSKYSTLFTIDNDKATCGICETSFPHPKGTGTGSIVFHLSASHPDEYAQFLAEQKTKKPRDEKTEQNILLPETSKVNSEKQKIKDLQPKIHIELSKWDAQGKHTLAIEDSIGVFIALNYEPYDVVNNMGFKHMMKTACPNFKLKGRNYFTNEVVPRVYEELFELVKQDTEKAVTISFTLDGWSSNCNIHSLLAVTGRWLDDKFASKYAVLGVEPVIGKHTCDNYVELFKKVLEKFNINKGQIGSITRDGGMESVAKRLQVSSHHCLAHVLQLVVKAGQKSLTEWGGVVVKLRAIVKKVHRSGIARMNFLEKIDYFDVEGGVPSADTNVRWSSLFKMVSQFLTQRKAVVAYLEEFSSELVIGENEWALMQGMKQLLEPLADITKSIQSRHDSPCSIVIPYLQLLSARFSKVDTENELIVQCRNNMQTDLKKRLKVYENNDTLKMDTLLDVRFKNNFFTDCQKDFFLKKCEVSFNSSLKPKLADKNHEITTSEEQQDEYSDFMKSKGEEFLKNRMCIRPEDDIGSKSYLAIQEGKQYLSEPVSKNSDPKEYWNDNAKKFPILSVLAKTYLSAPATSSESERVFSAAGLITTEKRTSLSDANLQKLLFTNLNYKVYKLPE